MTGWSRVVDVRGPSFKIPAWQTEGSTSGDRNESEREAPGTSGRRAAGKQRVRVRNSAGSGAAACYQSANLLMKCFCSTRERGSAPSAFTLGRPPPAQPEPPTWPRNVLLMWVFLPPGQPCGGGGGGLTGSLEPRALLPNTCVAPAPRPQPHRHLPPGHQPPCPVEATWEPPPACLPLWAPC